VLTSILSGLQRIRAEAEAERRPARIWINDILEATNCMYTGAVAASHGRPPIVERDDPFSVQPSVLMKDQEEDNLLAER